MVLHVAMENKELLEALRHIIKEETQAVVKEEVQPINNILDKIETDLSEVKERTSKIEERTLKIEIAIEHEIRPNIQLLKEGHCDLVRDIKEIKKDTSRIEKIETELFATREITKENVQSIKKLQTKRKI